MTTTLNLKETSSSNKPTYTASRRQTLGISDLLAFGVGLSSVIYINISGNLYLSEIFLLLLLPYLIFKRRNLLRFGYFKTIMFLGGVWILNQIITDLYRSTSTTDILKGWALIAVFLTNFLALYLLVFPSSRRIALGLLGFAIGTMLQPVLQPTANMLIDPWKFGLGPAVALLVTVIAALWGGSKPRNIVWWSVILIIIALFSFYVRSRSTGGVVLLTALCIWFRFTRIGQNFALRLNNPVNTMVGSILLFIVILGIVQTYGYAAEQGYFGEGSRHAYQIQSSGAFGVFLGARAEWWPAMHALMDSPFIGYGSYARHTRYGLYLYDLINLGYGIDASQFDDYLLVTQNSIPTHSHILQGWVWAGLAGGIFWLFIFGIIIRALIMEYRRPTLLLSATLLLGFSALWDILFSPLSNIGRLKWAFILVIILYASVPKSVIKDASDTRKSLS
jgi:hypothetical protein